MDQRTKGIIVLLIAILTVVTIISALIIVGDKKAEVKKTTESHLETLDNRMLTVEQTSADNSKAIVKLTDNDLMIVSMINTQKVAATTDAVSNYADCTKIEEKGSEKFSLECQYRN